MTTVLQKEMLDSKLRDFLYSKAIQFRSGIAAECATYEEGFVFQWIPYERKRVGMLKYKGIEVALYYRLASSSFRPEPGLKLPENTISESDNRCWLVIPLLGTASPDYVQALETKCNQLQKENNLLRGLVNEFHLG